MKINIEETVKFFDEGQNSRGHASAIVGIIGEDLNVVAFKHHCESEGKIVEVFDGPVTQGVKRGKRLDRWIYVKEKNGTKTLYQCEIKNWSATAIGGRDLPISEDNKSKDIVGVSRYYWEHQKKEFSKNTKPNNVTKVFLRMSYDRNEDLKKFFEREKINFKDCEQKPLLIYWMPISNDGDCKHYFSEKISSLDVKFKQDFKDVDIFSVS